MIIIGVDASYTRTGLAVSNNGKLILVDSIDFKGVKTKPEKRAIIKDKIEEYIKKYNPELIVVERVRQFSTGNKPFIAMRMIQTGISLQTTIVDIAYEYGLKVCSVDTRSWKSVVVGTSKPKENSKGIDPRKYPTLKFIESLGIDIGNNDDAADAACISLFYDKAKEKYGEKRRDELLKVEE